MHSAEAKSIFQWSFQCELFQALAIGFGIEAALVSGLSFHAYDFGLINFSAGMQMFYKVECIKEIF